MFRARPGPATIVLLVLFGVSFVAQMIADEMGVSLLARLGLFYELDLSLAYRWLTYPLVDAGPLARLLGMIFAYLMLSQHEATYGAKSTVAVSFAGVLGAAALCFPFGFFGLGSPLVGLSPLVWAPMGVLLASMGDRPVMLFAWVLPNARVAAGILLLLPTATALFDHDPTPLLEALGGAGGGLLLTLLPTRSAGPKKPAKKPERKHGFRVIQGGGQRSESRPGDDDDDPPKWLN